MDDMLRYERYYRRKGAFFIAGVDEAGCGPLAGPVVAASVIVPVDFFDPKIKDSKLLSAGVREVLFEKILEKAIDVGVGLATNVEIDKLNIRNAVRLAMKRALFNLEVKPDVILVDGNFFNEDFSFFNFKPKVVNIVKGDRKSFSIAVASIVAKVVRDKIMESYHSKYPQYNFKKHKGYPTKEHLLALEKYGVTEIHRTSYKPVREILCKRNLEQRERK